MRNIFHKETPHMKVAKAVTDRFGHHYHHKYRLRFPVHHTKIWWLDMFLLFVISGLVVFAIFANTILPVIPVPPIVRMAVLAPQTLESGVPAEFVVAYANDSEKELGCTEVRVHLPPNTVVEGLFPRATPDTDTVCSIDRLSNAQLVADNARHDMLIFNVGQIPPHGRETLSFTARTYGATGSQKVMTAEMRYWDEGKTAPDRLTTRNEWTIAGSALGLELTLPPRIDRGVSHGITVRYANRGMGALAGASVRLAVPEDFVVTGASPAQVRNGEWSLGALDSGEQGELTAYGYFRTTAAALHSAPTFTVRGYVAGNDGRPVLAEMLRRNADPLAAALSLETDVSGRQFLQAGETVTVTVRYRNAGDRPLRNLAVRLADVAPFIDAAAQSALAWNATTVPALSEVAPGAEGVLTGMFTVPAEIADDAFIGLPYPLARVAAIASYVQDDRAVLVDTAAVELPVATRLGLQTAAYYFAPSGDQVGVGPLPPAPGQKTKYLVTMTVTSSTGAAKNAIAEAYVPAGAEWVRVVGVTAGEALDYYPSTRRIRWQIGEIPARTGAADGAVYTARFEVAITPPADGTDAALLLLRDVDVHATDVTTGLPLRATADSVAAPRE